MKTIKLIILLSSLALSGSALAAKVNDAVITHFGAYGDGRLFIQLDKKIPEPNCTNNRIDIAASNPNIDLFETIAITAMANGNKVTVAASGCYAGFPTIDSSNRSWIVIKK